MQPSAEEEGGLGELGVAAVVDAAAIEQALLQQVQQDAGLPGTSAAAAQQADPEALEQQLRAVRRELRAVQAVVDGMGQQQQQQEQAAEDGGEGGEGGGAGALDSAAPSASAAAAAGGALQHAVMAQRVAGLEAQRQELEEALAAAGRPVLPAAGQPGPPFGAGAPAIPRRAGLPPRAPGAEQGRGGRKRKQKELVEVDLFEDAAGPGEAAGALVETERDRLIRLGVLTPFDRLDGFERRVESGPAQRSAPQAGAAGAGALEVQQHASVARLAQKVRDIKASKPTTKLLDSSELPAPERATRRVDEGFWRQSASGHIAPPKKKRRRTLARARLKRPKLHSAGRKKRREGEEGESGSEHGEESGEEGSEYSGEEEGAEGGSGSSSSGSEDLAGEFDDADEELYLQRRWQHLRKKRRGRRCSTGGSEDVEEDEEEDVVFEGGLRIPADIYARLFDYQKTGVKWLWELHTQRAGGIIGDEMGLGKTIQVITFLGGLHHSGLFRPSLVVCPATVLRQWLRELRAWYPLFRVAVLHDSVRSGAPGGGRPGKRQLIQDIAQSEAGVLVTTYDQMRLLRSDLLEVEWGYVVLDEGHKIRNPDAEATLAAKQMQTVHRIIMTGSPIQNRLTELWSLFDFVFPGKLGTLPVFQAQFALPIQIGGYANASAMQVSTAYKCAVILRDLISPYLLRRRKADVNAQLPKKTEQVLFCTLTPEQRELYKSYLSSKDLAEIFEGHRTALAGIDILRKICNHPDLLERAKWEAAEDYGNPVRSGKLVVLAKVLQHWKAQGHKALVFTQTQQMLDILERFVGRQGYSYHRMDGSTTVAMRARLIDDFNNNDEVFLFLLTTRVGGLGVNLTGANRVLLYDPDWNPSTDVQARERAWRIGQTRDVTVYRLITSGTVEEKIYHRQVYKHFLTDKVLRDPRQKRYFKARDLRDLFTLGDEYQDGTETGTIFASLDTEIRAEDLPAGGEGSAQQEQPKAEEQGEEEWAPSDRDDYVSSEGGSRPSSREGAPAQRGRAAGGAGPSRLGAGGGGGRLSRHRASAGSPSPSRAGSRQGGAAAATATAAPAQARGGAGSQGEGGAEGEDGDEGTQDKGDAKILRDLFEGRGVRSAIDHDKIEGASGPDRVIVDHEATRIARRAAEALRQSRLQIAQAPINQPTWTGRSGLAGAPGAAAAAQPQRFGRAVNPRLQRALTAAEPASQQQQQQQQPVAPGPAANGAVPAAAAQPPQPARRFGSGALAGAVGGVAPRSADILAQVRARQAAVAAAGHEAGGGGGSSIELERAQLLGTQIVSFLESRGGAAPSGDLVQQFQGEVQGEAAAALFRGVLKQVAQLQRRGALKVWALRGEFGAGAGGGGKGAAG